MSRAVGERYIAPGAEGDNFQSLVANDARLELPQSMPPGYRLGLQIVSTLVSTELDGSLGMHDAPGGGTDVVLRVPIGRRARIAQ